MLQLMNFIVSVGKVLCSGSNDGTMRIWNPKTGESIHRVVGKKRNNKYLFFTFYHIYRL